jgi:WD40 repeat protein
MQNTNLTAALLSKQLMRCCRISQPFWAAVLIFTWLIGPTRAQSVFVSSRNSHTIKHYDLATGNYLGDFVAQGSGGLSFPQEVLWHPDGFLLVTGRGNTAIKKYDGVTGAYLGNFTSGYVLDNPTKTTIWKDSLLYVSPWGATKNKVVRFDFKTGVFVDEFTSVGVPTGDSHAWDTAGNLYVPQWGDGLSGRVLKFDTAGTLAGTFIATSQLDGPVNIWFDTTGNLFVVDWTRGDLLQFNGTTGAFIATVINTTSQLEGFAFDDEGYLYLGDWTNNLVYRYDFAAKTLIPFFKAGGLQAPNSILIRKPAATAVAEDTSANLSLSVSPNPAGSPVQVRYFLEKTLTAHLEVQHVSGQTLAVLFSGRQTAGEYSITWDGMLANGLRAPAGLYFVRLAVQGQEAVVKLVWQ